MYLATREDHPGGGHCLQLLGASEREQHWAIVDQYAEAFGTLTARAVQGERDTGDGWRLTRPLLFIAHHLCEVTLKAALGPGRYGAEHDLLLLWASLKEGQQFSEGTLECDWIEHFLGELHVVTAKGFEGRYADKGFDDDVCCLNLDAVTKQLPAFVDLIRHMN